MPESDSVSVIVLVTEDSVPLAAKVAVIVAVPSATVVGETEMDERLWSDELTESVLPFVKPVTLIDIVVIASLLRLTFVVEPAVTDVGMSEITQPPFSLFSVLGVPSSL